MGGAHVLVRHSTRRLASAHLSIMTMPQWRDVVELLEEPNAKAQLSALSNGRVQPTSPSVLQLLLRLRQLLPFCPLMAPNNPTLKPQDVSSALRAAAILNRLMQPLSPSRMSRLPPGPEKHALQQVWQFVLLALMGLQDAKAGANDPQPLPGKQWYTTGVSPQSPAGHQFKHMKADRNWPVP